MKSLNPTVKTLFVMLSIVWVSSSLAGETVLSDGLQVAGWVENVSLFPGNLKVKAKLDTGARNSSLNANYFEEFERDGVKWVRFKLKNWKGRTESFEARVARFTKIKQHDNESAIRPVIRLGVCLGDVYKEVEVNLEDRGKFNYQMLIGRSFLRKSFLVNSSATFTIKSECRGAIHQ
jgi:hypothetical protein